MRSASTRGAALYRSMHRFAEPRVSSTRLPRTPQTLIDLGRVTRIWREQVMGDGRGLVEFDHAFAPGTGPMLAADPDRRRNNAVLLGGHYRINEQGMIEDDEENMAKHSRSHHIVRYSNPESWLVFFLQIGVVGLATTILVDMISGQLPARWNHKAVQVGRDVLLLLGGIMLARKHPVISGGVISFVAVDVGTLVYDSLDLDTRLRRLFRREAGRGQWDGNANIPRSHGLNETPGNVRALSPPTKQKLPWNSPMASVQHAAR